jgi:ribulose-5-phosphate 4-epimerase/fuculose-1-phosphate aldolase
MFRYFLYSTRKLFAITKGLGCSRWVGAIASKTGRNSSQVLHEAIALYLGENDASTVGVTLQDILNRLETVEQQAAIKVLLAR